MEWDDDGNVHIDIERMERALASPRFTVPHGLSDEELRQFILDCAAGKIAPDDERKTR